jgi:hypothetical protein
MSEFRRPDVDDLKTLWSRVSRQHLSGGQGCGCSFGGLILQASDFEIDIVEFLLHDAAKRNARHIPAIVQKAARGPDRYSLPALLETLATTQETALIETGELDFAIDRLRQTLTNIEAAHRKSRFACN